MAPAARAAVVLGIAVAAILPLSVERNPWIVIAWLAAAVLALAACRWTGWLGGVKALSNATWTAEGTWWLRDQRGRAFQGRLLGDSRVFAHWIWLRWDSPAGQRQAFLPRSEAVRRLAVRLRLEGAAGAGPDDPLP